MLTVIEVCLVIACVSVLLYVWRPSRQPQHGTMEERVGALERQNKELRNAIAVLLVKTNAFETQLPLTPEQKRQIKSLEDQITVTRYLDTIFPE